MVADGTYSSILKKYSVEDGAVHGRATSSNGSGVAAEAARDASWRGISRPSPASGGRTARRMPARRPRRRRLPGQAPTSTTGTSSSTRSSGRTGFILSGIWLTVSIAVISQIIGVILGVFGALGKQSKRRAIRWLAELLRLDLPRHPAAGADQPALLRAERRRIYGWPEINLFGFAIPGAVQAGIFALGVNEGAYMTEIVRAGIISVDPGQMEAAKSLGMTYRQGDAPDRPAPGRAGHHSAARQRVQQHAQDDVPARDHQRARAVRDLLAGSRANFFAPFELFLAAAVWYLLLTTIWGVIQAWIERRLGGAPAASRPAEHARAACSASGGR